MRSVLSPVFCPLSSEPRRAFLAAALALLAPLARAREVAYPAVRPRELVFPRDHGSHPEYRTEWWYVTGWVRDDRGNDFGIQVTFFRNRPGVAEESASAFAPRELLFAHAALADPRHGRLRHDQRARRAGFGLAQAAQGTTDVRIDDWWLRLEGDVYRTSIAARDFSLALSFRPTQPILLQGERGYSRKGPDPAQASYYYSRPHLAVEGTLGADGRTVRVTGKAWLDHEWSSEVLSADAAGWDWVGVNLADGGALMAFRIRARSGETLWAGGTLREAGGRVRALAPGDVAFRPARHWRSPRTGVEYPVAFALRAGTLDLVLEPLIDDQELDSRASVGTVYWEGAVRALAAGREVGRGYLELSGYWRPLRI
ncbi:MAG: carotenoid 1,2-hydratase [Burkholderiales bacterium]|nr:carotenoid 1,2-hydratase [Burkholderiales bacterium]